MVRLLVLVFCVVALVECRQFKDYPEGKVSQLSSEYDDYENDPPAPSTDDDQEPLEDSFDEHNDKSIKIEESDSWADSHQKSNTNFLDDNIELNDLISKDSLRNEVPRYKPNIQIDKRRLKVKDWDQEASKRFKKQNQYDDLSYHNNDFNDDDEIPVHLTDVDNRRKPRNKLIGKKDIVARGRHLSKHHGDDTVRFNDLIKFLHHYPVKERFNSDKIKSADNEEYNVIHRVKNKLPDWTKGLQITSRLPPSLVEQEISALLAQQRQRKEVPSSSKPPTFPSEAVPHAFEEQWQRFTTSKCQRPVLSVCVAFLTVLKYLQRYGMVFLV